MNKQNRKQGFTLVELSLSIGFIAVLSISVALIVTNSISAYHRGVILDQVNSTGMEIVDDMRAAIQNAHARSAKSACAAEYKAESDALGKCKSDNGRGFVSVTKYADVTKNGESLSENGLPVWGAFCSGSYSYIWNSGYYFNPDTDVVGVERASLKYKKAGGDDKPSVSNFKLLKVHDLERAICRSAVGSDYSVDNDDINGGTSVFDISNDTSDSGTNRYNSIDEEPYGVLTDDSSLALYEMLAFMNGESASINSAFYSVSFILGTVQGGININSRGDFCNTPADFSASAGEFDYCAINKFNFAAQANGG